jgi:hypothetical protein
MGETVGQRVTLDLPVVSRLLGLSRNGGYEAARRGDLGVPVLRVGRRIVVPRQAVEELLGESAVSAALAEEEHEG